jgi:hypothetical protein
MLKLVRISLPLVGLLLTLPAHAYSFRFGGEITEVVNTVYSGQTPEPVPVYVGDTFTGALTYTPQTADEYNPNAFWDLFSFVIDIGEYQIVSSGPTYSGSERVIFDTAQSDMTPAGWFTDEFFWYLDAGPPWISPLEFEARLWDTDWSWHIINSEFDSIGVHGHVMPASRVPEPGTLGLFVAALGALGLTRLRFVRRQSR